MSCFFPGLIMASTACRAACTSVGATAAGITCVHSTVSQQPGAAAGRDESVSEGGERTTKPCSTNACCCAAPQAADITVLPTYGTSLQGADANCGSRLLAVQQSGVRSPKGRGFSQK